jgi:hypothetical protein
MAGRLKLRRADEGRYGDPPIEFQHEPQTHSVRSRMLRPKIGGEFSLGTFVPTTQRQGK